MSDDTGKDDTSSLLARFQAHEEKSTATVSFTKAAAYTARINAILQSKPSIESLRAILILSFPTISRQDVENSATVNMARAEVINRLKLEGAFRSKSIRVLDEYMRKCCETFQGHACSDPIQQRRLEQVPHVDVSTRLPSSFHVSRKWKFLNIDSIHPFDKYGNRNSKEALEASGWPLIDIDMILPNNNAGSRHSKLVLAALHCMNARGTIAHEQQLETTPFTWNAYKNLTAVEIFDHFGGGVKRFSSQQEIQREIIENGPVVSLSFVPPTLYPMASHPAKLIRNDHPEEHAVLIVGWECREGGCYWLVKRELDGTQDDNNIQPLKVPMGQFHLEDDCIAPVGSFDNICWQHGPYFDGSRLPQGWIHRPYLQLTVDDLEAERLSREYGIRRSQPIVFRDANRLAHSRRYVLSSSKKWPGAWTLNFRKVG